MLEDSSEAGTSIVNEWVQPCAPSHVSADRAVEAGLCGKWEQAFSCRAWGWARPSQAWNVAFLEASIRTLSVRDIHWQVQGIALKETESLWCGGCFPAPYQLRGSSA